ncbi:hypothetical protein [Bacillus cereus]|uniref:hypothetical protein n=1 Tax=Bacillus cereus TaxID=1396 RepID=UPI00159699A5|nr:hypothetical protein [Bacillus cereus]
MKWQRRKILSQFGASAYVITVQEFKHPFHVLDTKNNVDEDAATAALVQTDNKVV